MTPNKKTKREEDQSEPITCPSCEHRFKLFEKRVKNEEFEVVDIRWTNPKFSETTTSDEPQKHQNRAPASITVQVRKPPLPLSPPPKTDSSENSKTSTKTKSVTFRDESNELSADMNTVSHSTDGVMETTNQEQTLGDSPLSAHSKSPAKKIVNKRPQEEQSTKQTTTKAEKCQFLKECLTVRMQNGVTMRAYQQMYYKNDYCTSTLLNLTNVSTFEITGLDGVFSFILN
jgi:hypothetical protein